MDVLILIDSFQMGGAENQALLFAAFLRSSREAEVEVWGGSGPGRCSEICDRKGIPWRSFDCSVPADKKKLFASLLKTVRLLRKEGPKVILSYGINTNVLLGLTWRFTRAKVFFWSQRHDGSYFSERKVESFAMRLTPRFIAISQTTKRALQQKKVPASKMMLIYNGIALDEPGSDRKAWRNKYQLGEASIAVGMMSNFTKAKDHLTLIRAWGSAMKIFKENGVDAKLFLGGRFDPGIYTAKALALDLGLSENICFIEEITDRSGFLGMLDIAVISSHTEGLSSVAIEYMACHLPVVATGIPAIEEVLSEENLPYLGSRGKPAEMSGKIIELAQNESLRKIVGEKNFEKFQRVFGVERMCSETLAAIRNYLT